jgi:nucleotide-binding universal stress UspA family protein
MYQTILLAYDGTRPAREALRQGTDLAILCRAAVHLLAVVAPDVGETLAEGASPSDLPALEQEEVKQVLTEGVEELRRAGLSVQAHLAAGNAAQEIGRVAREVRAQLIVVGHREQSSFSRWWRGSVSASLLSHAPCSVLVVIARTGVA